MSAIDAVRRRRSHPAVTADAPSHATLSSMIEAAASGADHGSLRPWRLIELRGRSRELLGAAFVEASRPKASGHDGKDDAKLTAKPLRAPLLIAIVAVHKPSGKVPEWEQAAAAAGVAHVLSLLLDEAGWGVIWRTGTHTRSEPVQRLHQLAPNEKLLGWLYVGGITTKPKPEKRMVFDVETLISSL